MRAYERLLNYVRVYTTSDPESGTHPSAAREFDLAHQLVEELKALGVEDARVDEHCYVYGSLPATPGCENKPALGLIAHMDTAPDASGENVNPILHENYDGSDVTLPATGMVMKVSAFPFLASMKGETLITTDGTTLLGADDKAGVSEIMTAVETVLEKGLPHGKLCIAFTPDEEIGRGADHFDVAGFGADYAYTVDGGAIGELEYENFNAASAKIIISGKSIHPGSAKGQMVNAALVAMELGCKVEHEVVVTVEDRLIDDHVDTEDELVPRAPVVVVMGHVDHGKTSLLDYIRNANVIAGEAGGITQHIGAYNVKLDDGRRITFLDTPGHEAFTAMRARGAKVTDIAIIIVAADDNVMPQTVEAINHASAAGVPIVFAINKIDKPNANPDKIKEELANMNYLVEDWGGKYQSQEISAKKGTGVAELLEKVLLEAEMLDLKANPNRHAVGSIIESSLDKGRGYTATVLVSNGTLHVGDIMVAGTSYGKIRAMFNERNQRIDAAGPAAPALVLGLNGAPTAGDTFNILDSDREAREIANRREQLQRELKERTRRMPGLDDIARRRALGEFHELNLIVKGDVDGSIEALSDSLIKLSTPEVQVNVIHKAVGAISESDVTLAAASDAVIIGFQVRPSMAARRLAENDGVDIRLYSIIYDAIEEIKDAMEGMLSPDVKEEISGTAEVLQTYKISKVGTIAGCMVREGKIKRSSKVRLIRDGIVIYTGELGSLKRFKDDVKEVASGYDCGLNIANYNDVKEGDIVEAYEEVEVSKSL